MSDYKPYPAYKDSGVEWLGKVPEHWKITAVKWEYELCLGKMLQPRPTSRDDKEVYYHKAISVQWEDVDPQPPEKMWASLADIDAYHICKGDLLVCEGGDVGRAGIFQGGNEEPLIIQNSLHRVRPKHNNLNEYLLRILQTVRYAGWFDVLCSKATIVHFTGDKFGSLAFSVAPPEEQKAIVNYLNGETARIDALTSKKTRFIELLREKRQALITQAVTRGLDPNVNMKDSGVEWLGEVPEHWDIGVLCHIASRTVVGIAEAATHAYANSGVPILRSTNIRPYKIIGEIFHINPKFALDKGTKLINAGDLITVRTGNAGVTAVIPAELDGCQCFTMLITTLQSAYIPNFYCYWMNSVTAMHYFALEGWGTAQINISVPILKALPVPMLSNQEQKEIVAYLDLETTRIDSLISKTQHSINLLKERRAALITPAVTGQIDVRNTA